MQTNYLLPNRFKIFGWILLGLGMVLGIYVFINDYESPDLTTKVFAFYYEGIFDSEEGFFKLVDNNITDEIATVMLIIGGLLVGFTKEKIEDEFIFKLRKDSLIWAVVCNYTILFLAVAFIYDMAFFHILVFNMFTPLLFFIIRFNFLKLKSESNEE